MTESLRSNEPNPDDLAVLSEEELESRVIDLEHPVVIIEQFLNQCRHGSIETSEQLASFILEALSKASEDGWTRDLQAQKLDPDTEQYEHLLENDAVYVEMFEWAIFTKRLVGRGDAMSVERKAFLQLWELRAGEVMGTLIPPDTLHDDTWRIVINKLFRDGLYTRYKPTEVQASQPDVGNDMSE